MRLFGRFASHCGASRAAGNVTNITLANELARLEQEVDATDAPEEEKSKLRKWLADARGALMDAGNTIAAKNLAELVVRV